MLDGNIEIVCFYKKNKKREDKDYIDHILIKDRSKKVKNNCKNEENKNTI